MNKVVVLNLGKGNLQTGFPFVTAQLQLSGKAMQFTGSLPALPELIELYRRWQLLYELLYKVRSIKIRSIQPLTLNQYDEDDIIIDESDITHVSDVDFYHVCQQLQISLDNWLDSPGFRTIERQLHKELHPEDKINFIIQTEDNQLRKIPWNIWQFFRDYPYAEMSLSSLNFKPGNIHHTSGKKVRILAIIGDSTGIDIVLPPQVFAIFTIHPTEKLEDYLFTLM